MGINYRPIRNLTDACGTCGVPEAWLVDLEANTLEVYREPTSGGYARMAVLHIGERVGVAHFADVEIGVDDLIG